MTAIRLLQDVRPTSQPQLWACYTDASGGKARQNLSRDEIASALASGTGTLWVDIDTRDANEVSILKDIFHFHPLAIEEAVNPQSRVKLEEFDSYLLLIVRTVPSARRRRTLTTSKRSTSPSSSARTIWSPFMAPIPTPSRPLRS